MNKIKLCTITKRFPGGVTANEEVTLEAHAGEVHVILGENGAGKTTLMRILAGLLQPTSGYLEIDGRKRRISSPQKAKRSGIGMVHQHFSLIPSLTVAENLALSQTNGTFWLNPVKWSRYLARKSNEYGMDIRPDAVIEQLSLGERQRIDIFRLILEGARVLILDEPTSILAPQEAERLFEHIRRFAAAGHIIFLITHKIHHVRAVGQKLSILRRGRLVKQCSADVLSDEELADLMVGNHLEVLPYKRSNSIFSRSGKVFPVLDVHNLSVPSITCPMGLKEATFSLYPGEVLGVAGISGNGQDELVAAITKSTPYQGTLHLQSNSAIKNGAPRIGYIPADRRGTGSVLSISMTENLALRRYRRPPFSSFFFLRRDEMKKHAMNQIRRYEIHPNDPSVSAGNLSGGNLQKVVVARELEGDPPLILAVNPTSGLDLATVRTVHGELIAKASKGAAILYVSEDLDELFLICDRILVLRAGQVEGMLEVGEVDKSEIGLLMSRGSGSPDDRKRGRGTDEESSSASVSIRTNAAMMADAIEEL
ncbi:MAG: ABC transporter ATP-binding protein [Porticoccaceae bacterium]